MFLGKILLINNGIEKNKMNFLGRREFLKLTGEVTAGLASATVLLSDFCLYGKEGEGLEKRKLEAVGSDKLLKVKSVLEIEEKVPAGGSLSELIDDDVYYLFNRLAAKGVLAVARAKYEEVVDEAVERKLIKLGETMIGEVKSILGKRVVGASLQVVDEAVEISPSDYADTSLDKEKISGVVASEVMHYYLGMLGACMLAVVESKYEGRFNERSSQPLKEAGDEFLGNLYEVLGVDEFGNVVEK